MRRQTLFSGLDPAWSAEDIRLDPTQLPARIAANGEAVPGRRSPVAVIDNDSVTLAQAANGPFLKVPLKSYQSVLLADNASGDGKPGIVLFHENSEFNVPLCIANDADELQDAWQAWGEALGRPLARDGEDAGSRRPTAQLGGLTVSRPRARRANTFFAARRPKFLAKRDLGSAENIRIHAPEAEIIARD
ncbi:DUF6101 family protein [Tepidamorphus sp. 3E244]|uniref:DUF6101 family protein n=1 Tax=Tepidamorphus sp. 3E244 TaxID=3385498 RepID=UPI0038FCF778